MMFKGDTAVFEAISSNSSSDTLTPTPEFQCK